MKIKFSCDEKEEIERLSARNMERSKEISDKKIQRYSPG